MKRRHDDLYLNELTYPSSMSICPVCGSSIPKDNIDLHVQQHFIQPQPSTSTITTNYCDLEVPGFSDAADFKICRFGHCQQIVSSTEWEDHLFAHSIEDHTNLLSTNSHQNHHENTILDPHNLNIDTSVHTQVHNTDRAIAQEQREMERLEIQSSQWNDHLLAKAIESEEQKEMEEQRMKEEEEFKKLQAMYGMNKVGGYVTQYSQHLERDVNRGKASVGDYYARKAEMLKILMTDTDSGESCTRGIIPQLHHRYKLGVSGTKQAWSSSDTDHYASTVGDAGWGCGYRNLQMLISALLRIDVYRPMLFAVGENVPSIPRIQQLIEASWNAGFDKQGAEQLACKLINTRKWIGATEIATVLRSLGLRANIIDFHRATGCDGTHPEMFSWIKRYFSCGVPGFNTGMGLNQAHAGVLKQTTRPPLYLQHQGHSRLVIGVEEHSGKDGGLFLLLFDPSHSTKQMHSLLDDIQTSSSGLRHLRRSLKQMRCKQYQIVYVDGIMDAQEMERSKILNSVRVP
ncbi:zinc finger-containing ubiquitin peptidase 1-like [Actinia tenebrosa]|uniref:Zinc finger-containing ubiquitin peptidase 1-like n=1 Tax=Actinia tenebrosa TaxID=6105 RepID=A0A6P8HP08_ACTTE|nr:zinc finger-containing ubiquitin peptidase 1-like [Actinia tenebrosa]